MLKYLIVSPHTKEECLKALDEILAKGADTLNKFDFGCVSGDHTGYALVEAENEARVRGMIPVSLRADTRIIQVGKFTPEQIRSFHRAA